MVMRMDSVCDAGEITYGFEAIVAVALSPFHTRTKAAELAHEVSGSDGKRDRQRGSFEIEDGPRQRCGRGCQVCDDEAPRLPAADEDKAGHAEFAKLLRGRVGEQSGGALQCHAGEGSATADAVHGGGDEGAPRESRTFSE